MSMEINFTDRESYLAWRASWREVYKAQAQDIRNIKGQIAMAYIRGDQSRASSAQRELQSERSIAQRMMKTLEEAKAISREARLAKVEQPQAA